MNHLRPRSRSPTAALNAVKRLLFAVRSSSIRSRNFDSRSGAVGDDRVDDLGDRPLERLEGLDVAGESSRSATCCVRRPPQIFCSVVTGSSR